MVLDVRLLYGNIDDFYRDDMAARQLFNLSLVEITALCLMDTDGFLLCDHNELYGRFINSYLGTGYNEISPLVNEQGNHANYPEEVYFTPEEVKVLDSVVRHLAHFCETNFPTNQFDWYIRTSPHHPMTYILEMEVINERDRTRY